MRTWLQGEFGRISAKSTLAEAIRYALRHWQGLGLFLDDGWVEIDSNTARSLAGFVSLALALTPWRSPGSSDQLCPAS
jgi:hypothetical protein